MVELLLFVGSTLGLSLLAAEGSAVTAQWAREREQARGRERQQKLLSVRSRMAQIEVSATSTRVHPKLANEYDRLVLEERILEADEL